MPTVGVVSRIFICSQDLIAIVSSAFHPYPLSVPHVQSQEIVVPSLPADKVAP